MASQKIVISKSKLEKWKKIEREMQELQLAVEAILDGEKALREGRTRPFKDFIKEKFPQHAKN
ncbi:MAG: hypothetical protein AAB877_00700 [Patescibacteria group bacterium]